MLFNVIWELQPKKEKGAEGQIDVDRDELRDRAVQMFARWMYDAGVEFNAVNYESLQRAIEAIGQYGPHMKAPTMHEVRVTCLKKEKDGIKKLVEENMEHARKYGCTLMCYGCTDKNGRFLVDFLMNTPKGSVFLESVDASCYSKTSIKMCELISKYVDEIGAENVVQVVTNNTPENALAGKLLEVIYPHLYWSPCAAHCIELMFKDIFKIPRFKKTIDRAIRVSGYIYSRTRVLSMMRKFINNKEMVRPAKTRFATRFLTLKRFQEEQMHLTRLFNSEEWHEIGELKPAMGYIYEAMDKAKEAIAKDLGYYLNPNLFYGNPDVDNDHELKSGFMECVLKMNPDVDMQNKIEAEIKIYRNGEGLFGSILAKRIRMGGKDPVEWQKNYGASAPNLKRFAIRVLDLVCSLPVEEIGVSLNMNKLTQQRLNDLVYIKYNRALKRRYHLGGKVDPIMLSESDDTNEWLTGEPDNNDSSIDTEDIDDLIGVDVGADELDGDYNLISRLHKPMVRFPSNRMFIDEESEEEETTPYVGLI